MVRREGVTESQIAGLTPFQGSTLGTICEGAEEHETLFRAVQFLGRFLTLLLVRT